MRYSIFFFIILIVLTSCGGQKKGKAEIGNNQVEVQIEEFKFPPQNVLQLKSYYLSSPVHSDSADILIGYNHRMHSLDYIDVQGKKVSQVLLPKEGPNAIFRLSGIYAHTLDSIWLTDESEHAFLIDSIGNVQKKIHLKERLKETDRLFINTNYAMYTSHLYYNRSRQSLCFLVRDLESKSYSVKEVPLETGKSTMSYELLPSKVIPDMSNGYTYINTPNVNFVGEDMIVYNYPVESSIYTLNVLTGEKQVFDASSSYTPNLMQKCTSSEYSAIEKQRVENPHFYDVMYIPGLHLYARLHTDKVEFDATQGLDKLINAKALYLMLFDGNFEKVCEVKLPARRYNPYTGWSASYHGIMFFVDNILDEKNDTDDLTMDLISSN